MEYESHFHYYITEFQVRNAMFARKCWNFHRHISVVKRKRCEQKILLCKCVTFIPRNKMRLRWLLIRLHGWCNLVLPLPHTHTHPHNLLPSVFARYSIISVHLSENGMLLMESKRKVSSVREQDGFWGHEQSQMTCFFSHGETEKEASTWCTDLMTWQSSSIKSMATYWYCSRQVFRTIFTDSI